MSRKNKICGVYKVTNPIGEIYIGQSTSIVHRWQSHKRSKYFFERLFKESLHKYGADKHTFEIIEECDKSQLKTRERFYQEQYFLGGYTMLNLVLSKRDGYPTRTHPSTKILLAERTIKAHTGLKRSTESKERMRLSASYKSKPVHQFDLEMNFIAEYRSACEAARQCNLQRPHISDCCTGKSKTHGGFKWEYAKVLCSQEPLLSSVQS